MATSYAEYDRIKQEQRGRRLLEQHLEKVQERLQHEDLSVLELQALRAEKMAESADATPGLRERLESEVGLLDGIIKEQDPDPTIDEEIASLREHGLKDDADELEHALNKTRKREEITRLRSELEYPDLPSFQRSGMESTLQKALEDLAHMEAHHPIFERQAKAKALREDAHEIEVQLGEMRGEVQRPATERLYRELSQRHEALLTEADAVESGEAGTGDAASDAA